ncbi:MAG: hypothetical protein HQL54_12050 [Magnetococcales bacterium]|nr:hypothetical protein [Magnetococcales bacterium]
MPMLSVIYRLFLCSFLVLLSLPKNAEAVNVAPRISDREIIESLAQLKEGQKQLSIRIDDLRAEMKENVTTLRAEMKENVTTLRAEMKENVSTLRAEMKGNATTLRAEMKAGMDGLRREMNIQSNQANQRMDRMHTTMLTLFGALVTLIVALFGYIAWDRRTMMKPFQERLGLLEKELHQDLDLQHPEGSRITRMLHALRELAKQDEKVATILRSFSLL